MSAARLALALTLLLVTTAQAAKKPREPRELIDRFYEALGKKDRETAAKLGDQLLARDPQNITLLQMLVRIHSESADWPRTIDRGGRCLKIQPWNADCLRLRADAYHQTHQYDQEIADLGALYKLPGRGEDALKARAWAYRCKSDLALAAADYRAVLADRPDDQRSLWGLVEVAVEAGDVKKAEASLAAMIAHLPSRAVSGHYDLALVFAAKKDTTNAVRQLDAALGAGYVDRDHLRKDAAFAGLRSSDEYRALVAKYHL
jgi:tetratricopeptide (TPR) repeat protein